MSRKYDGHVPLPWYIINYKTITDSFLLTSLFCSLFVGHIPNKIAAGACCTTITFVGFFCLNERPKSQDEIEKQYIKKKMVTNEHSI